MRALSVTMSRKYAPSVHRNSEGDVTSESIVFCGGTNCVFMTKVGLIKIPPSGILIMLSAQDTAHVACLCASDAKLKATPANIKHALEKGKVSIAQLQQRKRQRDEEDKSSLGSPFLCENSWC